MRRLIQEVLEGHLLGKDNPDIRGTLVFFGTKNLDGYQVTIFVIAGNVDPALGLNRLNLGRPIINKFHFRAR